MATTSSTSNSPDSAEFWREERLLIDGSLRPASGGATYDNIGPASGSVIGVAADASADDVEAALVAESEESGR